MSARHVIAKIEGGDGGRHVELTQFPNAPLVRIKLRGEHAGRDGIVLDLHGLRDLLDAVSDLIDEFEEAP